jgi:hypothetical protein
MSDDTSTEVNEREVEVFSGDERQAAMLRWSAQPGATRDYWVELSGPNGGESLGCLDVISPWPLWFELRSSGPFDPLEGLEFTKLFADGDVRERCRH